MPDEKKSCFIIMPITTPSGYLERYHGDEHHFMNVMNYLFVPAILSANMEPVLPIARGAEMILREIIGHLATADMVLCDMSIFNPNVFFELGVRVSFNKPVCLVKDDKSPEIPFDVAPINHHKYSSNPIWKNKEEIEGLSKHISESVKSSESKNPLWRALNFSISADPLSTNSGTDAKVDFIIQRLEVLSKKVEVRNYNPSKLARNIPNDNWDERVTNVLRGCGLNSIPVSMEEDIEGRHIILSVYRPLANEQWVFLLTLANENNFVLTALNGARTKIRFSELGQYYATS
jgi:hypothetical protein